MYLLCACLLLSPMSMKLTIVASDIVPDKRTHGEGCSVIAYQLTAKYIYYKDFYLQHNSLAKAPKSRSILRKITIIFVGK